MTGNPAQPGTKILATSKASQIPPSREEHLLRQIIRLRDIVDLSGHVSAQHQFIPPHHLEIQIVLPALDAVEQLGEVGFVGVHAAGEWLSSKMCRYWCRSHKKSLPWWHSA